MMLTFYSEHVFKVLRVNLCGSLLLCFPFILLFVMTRPQVKLNIFIIFFCPFCSL